MEEVNIIKRETAKIYPIKYIKNSTYIQEDGLKPNYIETNIGKISRINLIGIVVLVESNNKFLIDDGTGTIEVYDFSNNLMKKKITSGDFILTISKIRKMNENICLVSEIISKEQIKNNSLWFEYRRKYLDILMKKESTQKLEETKETKYVEMINKELPKHKKIQEENIQTQKNLEEVIPEYIETPKEIKFEIPSIKKTKTKDVAEKLFLDTESVLKFIKENDSGKGCQIEEVISRFGEDVEKTLNTLISMGDVYEIKSGFLKLLE
jgi:RPA family protein